MNASELQARVGALETLMTELLKTSPVQRQALRGLADSATTPQQRWMAEWWWWQTGNRLPADTEVFEKLEQRRGKVFSE